MARIKYILSNINLLNCILTGLILYFVYFTIMPFLSKSIHFSLPPIQNNAAMKSVTDNMPEPEKSLSQMHYAIIAEQNLFHPERKIPLEAKETQPALRPDFILYGTLVSENLKMAFLDDLKSPYSSRGRGKRQRSLKAGQSLSGYTLSEVFADKVVMTKGDEQIIVAVNDPSKPKRMAARSAGQSAEIKGKQPPAKVTSAEKPGSPDKK